MRKILVGESQILGKMTSYYLLVEDLEDRERYGVEIGRGSERDCVLDVAPQGGAVWALAESLFRGAVTPASLRDVVDDWLLR